ncbi:beta-1,3-galactosyltransferase 5-like [Diprion similis]|uniref:beta-1,3-galactosyltransferase 5-like n=1 Tax=Diprion similis TaxID=362088 RepID=UPI001EF86A52|nr:beta-1,3-galactosyltransferase 5-like [Diprion similis]
MSGDRFNICVCGRPFSRRILVALVCFIMCPICVMVLLNTQTPDFKLYISNMSVSPAYSLPTTANSCLPSKDDVLVAHPDNDKTRLIDLRNFTFTINHTCNNSHPLIVALIHTAPKNYAKRMIIRETWGKKIYGIMVFFFVGMSTEFQCKLEEEDKTYGDIVQGNFIDSYRNLTYKHVMDLKWAKYHCPDVKYVLKLDDDVFVNTPAVLAFLARNMLPWGENRVMRCNPASSTVPQRKAGDKWMVTKKEYPGKTYPAYCLGWVIFYTLDTVSLLYEEAQCTPYFWIDDVHISGIVAKKVNLTYTSLNSQILRGKKLNDFIKSPDATVDFLVAGPQLTETDSRALWKAVVSIQ